ncbi:hypothetical protein EDB82DRAFT_447028 [Fusarium venenatum]|uniref:uncharacterized protein n=1 Tax=Fusarium venenatum TaxID=56646 RepID=UPI001DC740AE|nr:hypothetical protein EDB82DRAFT_447028 [Fusarium venenatum]
MRFTPGLLLALASSVTAQRFTNSSIPATGSATESATGTTTELAPTSSAGPPQPVDLSSATLGPGASFSSFPDGSLAILLSAGPNGIASFSVGGAFPFGIIVGDLIQILFSILVELLDINRKRADGGCTLDVTVDGVSVFTEGLETTGGVVSRSSSGTPAGDSAPVLEFVQSCGANPSALTVGNVKVAADDGSGGGGGNGGGGNGGNTDTETGTAIVTEATLTNSEGEPTATVTDTIIPTDTEVNTNSEGATTNSEGETVVPTGTNTNSEGATTNSEGETIVPTGTETATDVNTNSEGATTNSEGETITATGTETAPTSTATSAAGFPGSIDNFVLFGCVGSTNGFPTFELAQSSGSMDLDECAGLCVGRSYFGVHDTDCYCGDEINDDDTERVNLDSCDIECPGDDSEFCGGDAPLARRSRFSRRQSAIPNTILLTVYVNLGGPDVTLTDVITATVTDQSTITTTFTTTIDGPSTTQTQTVTAIYVCSNGHCYDSDKGGRIVYIFKPYPGEDCDGQYVYISEACDCKGGSQYVPKYCTNGSCHGLTVYKPEQCDDWYNYDVCYTPADCESCEHGQVIYKPWENTYGTPDHPKVPELPVCSSSHCPDTEHGSKPAPPCYGDHCEGSGSKPTPPCYGDHCEESGSKPAPPCTGDHCEESGSKPAPPCTGDHCEESGSKPAPPSGGGSSDSGSKPAPPSGGSDSGSKPAPPSGGSDSGYKPAPPSGGESDSGSKGSSGGESSGEAPCSGDHCEPTIVSSAGKQAVGGLALLAAVAAALL